MLLHAEQGSAAATLRSKGGGVVNVSRTTTRHDYGIDLAIFDRERQLPRREFGTLTASALSWWCWQWRLRGGG